VYSVRRRFSAPAHSTHAEARWSAVVQPAISTFQRHGTQHLLHCRPPSSFHLVPMWPCVDSCSGPVTSYYLDFARVRAPRGVPSGFVQRTGCGACGLGHPHQVWWAPPMYIARAWCLAPVSSAGMSTYLRLQAPRAFAQVFAHCRFVQTAIPAKKKWIPHRPTAQALLLIPSVYRPPRGGGARSGIPPCSSARPQPTFILFLLLYLVRSVQVVYCIWLYTPLPHVHLSA
jgi:hypothetical protein